MNDPEQELIQQLLSREESLSFECKRAKKKPAEVLPTICAFANAEGGFFVYGIADKEKVKEEERLIGVSEANDHVDELAALIAKEFDPPLTPCRLTLINCKNIRSEEDRVLLVHVFPSKDVHSIKSGETYLRIGKKNVRLTHKQSLQLQYEKGSISFESEGCSFLGIDDLNLKIIKEFMDFNQSQEADILKFLYNNGLANKKNSEFIINHAAVLLFAENPAILLKKKVGVTIAHYFGVKSIPSEKPNFIRQPFTIEGSLIDQIRKAFDYVSEHSMPVRLQGATFQRKKIPPFAIQEAITNAVIHRDYSIQDHIQIRIFDDRIEIESPGWFPGLVDPENILDSRCARNPIIERTLKKIPDPPNLDIGEGVNRMFLEMYRKHLFSPFYLPRSYSPHSVKVILFNEERPTYWDMVSKYLDQNGRVSNKEFRNITGLGMSEASELLKKWVSKQLLEKKGDSKRSTYYQRPGYKKRSLSRTAFLDKYLENI